MGRRGSAKQRAAPLCTFAEADPLGILEKGRELLTEGGSRDEGGGKLPLLECKLILDFFLERTGLSTAYSLDGPSLLLVR